MIKAVDLGNYNVKTDRGNIFPSRFVEDNSNCDPLLDEYIKLNGKTYLIGRGKFDNTFSKSKKDYLPNLLYAICLDLLRFDKVSRNDITVKVALGVPVDNLGIADELRSELINKTFDVEVNKNSFSITIEKVAVIGEGISSYYTLDNEVRKKDIALIDIGGRTINVVAYKSGKLVERFTIPMGTINLFDEIKTLENNKNGQNYEVHEIEEYLKKGIIGDYKEQKDYFVKKIVNEIALKLDLRLFNVFLTGGGVIILKDNLNAIQEVTMAKIDILKDALFSNVKGNKKLAQMNWKEN